MRTVIEDDLVSFCIDRDTIVYPRLADAFEGLKWWLARKPGDGFPLPDGVHWVYHQNGEQQRNVPHIVVVYRFDSNSVQITYVKTIKP